MHQDKKKPPAANDLRSLWQWVDTPARKSERVVERIDDFEIERTEPVEPPSSEPSPQKESILAPETVERIQADQENQNRLKVYLSISEVEDAKFAPVNSTGHESKVKVSDPYPDFLQVEDAPVKGEVSKVYKGDNAGEDAYQQRASDRSISETDRNERRLPAVGGGYAAQTETAPPAAKPELVPQRRSAEPVAPVAPRRSAPRQKTPPRQRRWGYGFVVTILLTIFGSITVSTYLVFLRTSITIPNIIVYVSIIALFFFLLLLVVRYLALIYLSFLHHAHNRSVRKVVVDPSMKASILVPAYNEEKVIEKSILSLLQLDYPNYEVIVINDGSKDKTYEIAKRWEGVHQGVQVKVLTQKNMGKAMALNHGARMSEGDVVVCMDGDSRLDVETLKYGMRHFQDPTIGAVAGNVKVVNRRNLWTMLQALEYIEGLNLVRRAQAFLKAVNIVPGPMGFFRRDVLLKVGGWDKDTYAEDCDLTLKILTKRYKIEYEPEAISYTEAPEGLVMLLKQRYRWTRGILQAMRKYSIFLINPKAGWRVALTMWQMVFESIIWPLMNVGANVLFLIVAFLFGMSPLIVLWWIQLTVLDTIAAMHTVAIEREKLYLIPFAIIYRLVFIQIVDVAKLIATIEEMFNIKMGWGKVERTGRL